MAFKNTRTYSDWWNVACFGHYLSSLNSSILNELNKGVLYEHPRGNSVFEISTHNHYIIQNTNVYRTDTLVVCNPLEDRFEMASPCIMDTDDLEN